MSIQYGELRVVPEKTRLARPSQGARHAPRDLRAHVPGSRAHPAHLSLPHTPLLHSLWNGAPYESAAGTLGTQHGQEARDLLLLVPRALWRSPRRGRPSRARIRHAAEPREPALRWSGHV